jgi:hypothetical protein
MAPLYLLRYSTADLLFVVDIQGKPTIVHVGHYGQPTVTPVPCHTSDDLPNYVKGVTKFRKARGLTTGYYIPHRDSRSSPNPLNSSTTVGMA